MSVLSQLQDELSNTRQRKDRAAERIALQKLAQYYVTENQWNRWLACETEVLPLVRETGTPKEIAETLINLGAAYTNFKQLVTANKFLEEARKLAVDQNLIHQEAAALNNLARLQSLTNKEQSLQTYEESLRVAQELSASVQLGLLQGAIWTASQSDHTERLKVYYTLGIKCARQIGDTLLEGNYLLELGLILASQNSVDEAAQNLQAARPLIEHDPNALARCDQALAKLPPETVKKTETSKAAPTNHPAIPPGLLSASQRLKKNPRDVLGLIGRAELYLSQGQHELALRDTDLALQIALAEPRLQGKTRQTVLSRLEDLKSRATIK